MNEHDLLDAVGGIDEKYVNNAAQVKKNKGKVSRWIPATAGMAAAVLIMVGIGIGMKRGADGDKGPDLAKNGTEESLVPSQGGNGKGENPGKMGVTSVSQVLFNVDYNSTSVSYVPSVAPYQAAPDLSNVTNVEAFYFQKGTKELLAANNFVITQGQSAEFFDIYESNRYMQLPSFITADSMMHTYHLYFAMLQKKVEKEFLCHSIETLTVRMLENSKSQLEALKGSEWEEAAKRNVAYFGVAARLLELDAQIPAEVSDVVSQELQKIMSASGIENSLIMMDREDYSQYKPRGYYDGDAQLEKYFRAMMLYGHTNFAQKSEEMNRSALLMTLAMKEDEDGRKSWGDVYGVTAFFAGQSDDLGYFEYLTALEEAYGKDVTAKDLAGNANGFARYLEGIYDLRAPEINSVVFEDDGGESDKRLESKGFRFMGQRFTMDAAVFTKLTYSQVEMAEDGMARLLPDGLDVPAAFGSDLALELLIDAGNDRYPNYLANMQIVRDRIRKAKDYWSSSLYSGWLYTLMPLLEEKGEGYPSFMTNRNWQKKSLEGYLGSWTELKHDTILYAKQSMAEMGGGDIEEADDRGYVEPQPELYARLAALTRTTQEGLEQLGFLGESERDGLQRLGSLAMRLRDISVKELQNEKLTDEDYELIRDYGGSLEHLWYDTVKADAKSAYADSAEFPMAIVADVATNPNGVCLEEAIGGAACIYVIFPIDGELHIGVGGVFNYYQFIQPISDRLTDKEWRIKLGMQLDDNDEFRAEMGIRGPEWTDSYRYYWKLDDEE